MDGNPSSKKPGYVEVDGHRFPPRSYLPAIRGTMNLQPKPDDVILVSYVRCGTNWTQQIITLLRKKGVSVKNYTEMLNEGPILEMDGIEAIENMERPRFYRTHFRADWLQLSSTAKYIWVARNPKDCLVSYYHIAANITYDFIGGEFDTFFEVFLNGETSFGDYFDHLLSWYRLRSQPNVLCIYYEELKEDLEGQIRKIAKFLGPEYDEMIKDQHILDDILKFSSFDHMKTIMDPSDVMGLGLADDVDIDNLPITAARKEMMKFYRQLDPKKPENSLELARKGVVGGWRECFTEDQNKRLDQKIQERMSGTDLLKFWQLKKLLVK